MNIIRERERERDNSENVLKTRFSSTDTHLREVHNNILTSDVLTFHFLTQQGQSVFQYTY